MECKDDIALSAAHGEESVYYGYPPPLDKQGYHGQACDRSQRRHIEDQRRDVIDKPLGLPIRQQVDQRYCETRHENYNRNAARTLFRERQIFFAEITHTEKVCAAQTQAQVIGYITDIPARQETQDTQRYDRNQTDIRRQLTNGIVYDLRPQQNGDKPQGISAPSPGDQLEDKSTVIILDKKISECDYYAEIEKRNHQTFVPLVQKFFKVILVSRITEQNTAYKKEQGHSENTGIFGEQGDGSGDNMPIHYQQNGDAFKYVDEYVSFFGTAHVIYLTPGIFCITMPRFCVSGTFSRTSCP